MRKANSLSSDKRERKKRIYHVLFIVENNTIPPDIRVWREARTAVQAGYSVSIISPKNDNFLKSYELIDGVEIYRHFFFKNRGGILNQLAEYANAIFWEVLLSVRIFIKKRFYLIHAANPPDHVFLIAFFFKLFGVKFIFDHHDLAPELYISKFNGKKNIIYKVLNGMEKLSCLTADAVISTNQSYKDHIMKKYGIKPEKIFVVRNDPEALMEQGNGRRVPCRNSQMTELIYIGSINNQDGVDLLVKAVDILVKQLGQMQIHCTVVGDGDDLPRVKKLCAELRLNPYFNFTGYIYDRHMVEKCIEAADICLETAPYSEANGKSTFIKVMEYMAAGKPLVAFDLDETRYSAQGSALFIEQGNLRAFAEAIETLIRDPALREQLGKNGQSRIQKVLNWKTSSKELMRTYENLFEN